MVDKVAVRIGKLVKEGMTVREAFDRVLGEGAYDKFASDLYDEFQKRQKE